MCTRSRAEIVSLVGLAVLIAGCQPIDLREYVIAQVVGLEEVTLESSTVTNDLVTETISWQEVEGAALYRYQWDATDADGWTEIVDTSFQPDGDFTEGTHTLYLQVQNADGLWSPIYSFEFVFDATLPDAPLVIAPATTTSLRPTWSWSAVEDATGYSYQLDQTVDDGWTETQVLSYTPEADLAPGEHTLYVRAKNADNKWSGWGRSTVEITESLVDDPDDPADDATAPTVSSSSPTDGATGVAGAATVSVTFSEAMNTTATEGAFSLVDSGSTAVTGTFSWSSGNTVMTFDPSGSLVEQETYTYAVTTAATDVAGNALAPALSGVSFTVADATAPTVDSSSPTDDATDVAVTTTVSVTFSEAMNTTATESAFSLLDGSSATVSGTFSWSSGDTVMTFTPSSDLNEGETYTYAVTTAATDAAGNQLSAALGDTSFTVEDNTAPTIDSHTPGTADAVPTVGISVTFSEAMNTTATEGAFSLVDSESTAVTGTFSWSSGDTVMTFDPSSDLTEGETYTYAVTTAATDAAGNPLSAALGDTSFTVVGLFGGTTTLLADGGSNAHNKDLIWDSTQAAFLALLYTDTGKLHLSSFADTSGIPMASTAMLQSHNPTYLGDARVLRTGTTYSAVFDHDNEIFFNKVVIPISGAQDASISEHTTADTISEVAAAWNPDDEEVAIAWIEGSVTAYDIWFMRVDTDGNEVEAPVNLTGAPDKRHSIDVFWTGSSYSIVYVQDDTKENAFLRVVTPGSPSSAGAAVQLTPSAHDIRNPLVAVWTGAELGIAWLDPDNGKIPYFGRFDASGTLLSGMPAGGSEVLTDYSGTNYTSGYNTTYDNIDLAYDGAGTYALVWSQRDDQSTNVGAYETQFCTIEDVSGTWKAPSAPVIISQDDGSTKRNLYPHVAWDGSTWAATWVVTNDSEIYFRQ